MDYTDLVTTAALTQILFSCQNETALKILVKDGLFYREVTERLNTWILWK